MYATQHVGQEWTQLDIAADRLQREPYFYVSDNTASFKASTQVVIQKKSEPAILSVVAVVILSAFGRLILQFPF